jgi:phage terminase large subunit
LSKNPFVEFVDRYADDVLGFVRQVFGVEPDPWQIEVLQCYQQRERRISIRSAHGVGKTAVVAWMSIHHLLFRFPQKTAATAPSRPQAFDAYFAEVKHWIKKLPQPLRELLDVKADRIELKAAPQSSFLSVRTSRQDQPEALQGIHSDNVLLIVDEASGVPEGVFEAAAGSMSGEQATTVLIGNPVRTSGLFFDTHTRLQSTWKTFHVSAFDSQRVSDDFIKEMGERYGESSNAYRVRVLGEFPLVDDDSVIPYHLIEEARLRDLKPHPESGVVWGLDVARFGSDRSALCKRQGSVVLEPVKTWKGLDLMQLTGVVQNEYISTPPSMRPKAIYVDAIGLGAGVADRLRELGVPVRAVNVSESPALKGTYLNLKAELWFRAKEWLQSRVAKLPEHDGNLCSELSVPKYKFNSSGRLQIESKEEIKKRSLPSPDAADAFVLTFAGGGAIMAYGSSGSTSWAQPLKRGLKGV